MRLSRPQLGTALVLLCSVACDGYQQGYYGPCDEPAGAALDCPTSDSGQRFSVWDACTKLAACGVIVVQRPDDDQPAEQPTPFDACVEQVARAGDAIGSPLLTCIDTASCPDLQATDPDAVEGNPDPNPGSANIEGVIGWCGRLDPR